MVVRDSGENLNMATRTNLLLRNQVSKFMLHMEQKKKKKKKKMMMMPKSGDTTSSKG